MHGEKMIYVADLNSTVHPISVGEGGGVLQVQEAL